MAKLNFAFLFIQGQRQMGTKTKQHIDRRKRKTDQTVTNELTDQSANDDKLVDADHISVFYRPKENLVNLRLKPEREELSIFLKENKELINITLKDKFRISRTDTSKLLDEHKDPAINSVDEMLWKRMRHEPGSLPNIYIRLAKARLSG